MDINGYQKVLRWSALVNYGGMRDKKHMSWFSTGSQRLSKGPPWSALVNYGWMWDKKHMSWFSNGYQRLSKGPPLVRFG